MAILSTVYVTFRFSILESYKYIFELFITVCLHYNIPCSTLADHDIIGVDAILHSQLCLELMLSILKLHSKYTMLKIEMYHSFNCRDVLGRPHSINEECLCVFIYGLNSDYDMHDNPFYPLLCKHLSSVFLCMGSIRSPSINL